MEGATLRNGGVKQKGGLKGQWLILKLEVNSKLNFRIEKNNLHMF